MRVFLTGPTAFVGSVFVQDPIRSRSLKARRLRPHISDDFLCFAERLVIAIATAYMTMAVISGFGPGLFDALTQVTSWSFSALWIIALILSMGMPIHAIRNLYFAPEGEEQWSTPPFFCTSGGGL